MKTLTKRSLAWLTSLLLFVSLFSTLFVLPAEAATVDYTYSGKYVYNWGTREVEATFLSPMAEAWYAKNGITYEELAALKGGNGTSDVTSSALYNEVQDLMVSNHKTITSYSDTKNLFKYTDCQNGGGKISSFYSGKEIGPSWDGGWNREHTWPNSKGEGDGENDIIMLRPTSTSENSGRGNKAYGQSSGYYNPNSESGGKYDLRGDVARIMLYQHVRWSQSKLWGTSGVMESLSVLLAWVEDDPVDTWELGRNDAVEAITGTRNVFVDYPELIFVLFGAEIPSDYQTPSGKASEGAYAINASVNNSAYGSVVVSGKNITASPKTGYAVSGYTILSGDATVVRNGNVFTVTAASDVEIRIDFAPRTQVQVQFSESNAIADTQTVYSGDSITLPAHSGEVTEGMTFVGWVDTVIHDTTDLPAFYTAGSQYTVGKNTTLYALYSRTETDGGALSNVFEPYSGPLTEGDYLIVFEGKAMTGVVTDKTRLQVTEVSTNNGNIIVSADNIVWHIAPNGSDWTMLNLANGNYAAGTSVKSNQATLSATLTDLTKWTVEVKSTGYEFTNVGRVALGATYNPLLRYNPSVDAFACYAKNTNVGGPNKLYKRAGGTTYYFTQVGAPCEHTYTTNVSEPTCGADGATIYTCTACGHSYSETIPATGAHLYDDEYDADCNTCGAVREVPDKPQYVPGDLNGDGSLNNRDLALLQKHLNDWEVIVVVEALDVNGDDSVNNRDLAALQKILNQ